MPNQFIRPWTEKETEFVRDTIGKLTYAKMGTFINRSYSAIQSKVRYLPFQKKIKKHSVNSNLFKKWSRDMAYVLGFVAADGNICHSGNAHTLHIASDDKDVIEKIRKVIDYHGPIYEKPRSNGKISYNLRICDRMIFYDLEKLGITERKSLTLYPNVHKDFVVDFLRGFLDGDGTIYLRSGNQYISKLRVIFYTASYPMAHFIQSKMKNLLGNLYNGNIHSRITKQKTLYYSIGLGHKASTKLLSILYADTNLYMDRKFQKFLQGIKNNDY